AEADDPDRSLCCHCLGHSHDARRSVVGWLSAGETHRSRHAGRGGFRGCAVQPTPRGRRTVVTGGGQGRLNRKSERAFFPIAASPIVIKQCPSFGGMGRCKQERIVMNVGVPGLGKMGAAIALRLIDVGHKVTVWNRSADKSKPAAAAGASVAATPAELATA